MHGGARWCEVRRFAPVALLVFVTACSPTCRLELRFVHGSVLDPALFHLTAKKACPPTPVRTPPPAPRPLATAGPHSNDVEWQEVKSESGGLHVLAAFRGHHCRVRVTGFYDSNRDSRVGAGDLVASSADLELADNGIFRGNLTAGPVLRLSPIPSAPSVP